MKFAKTGKAFYSSNYNTNRFLGRIKHGEPCVIAQYDCESVCRVRAAECFVGLFALLGKISVVYIP